MTLSGGKDRQQRAEAARAARQARHNATASKRPWLLPVVVTVAVLALVYVIIVSIARGNLFG
ncbi:MAG TPA: cell division protein CrgA [Pseudolysinimonas sp.]|nr:cell division protein CrgA [Pseudolysinimonas sp.]